MKAIIIKQDGSLGKYDVNLPKIKSDQVLIKNTCLGVNNCDTYQARNKSQMSILGVEAIGEVVELGASVSDFKIGDRVGYCSLYGTYSEYKIIKPKHLVRIPSYITDEIAAAVLFKGTVAHYLLRRAYILRKGACILVHDADSDVGQLLCQWASYLEAKVIGTVSDDDRAEIALDSGCEYVVNYYDTESIENIFEITQGMGVNAVYDSVGRATCKLSFGVLAMLGVYIVYDETSGAIPKIDPQILKSRSLFFTNSSVFHYKSDQMEMNLTAREVFSMVRLKRLKPKIAGVYTFEEVKKAREDLNSKTLDGQLIVKL